LNNPYLKESLRLKALAQDAFDYGDYDASAKYSAEALKNAQLSDEYVTLQLKIMDADKAIAKAKAQLDWAVSVGADASFPSPFNSAKSNYDEALQERTDKKYDEALASAQRSIADLAWVPDAFAALQAKIKAVDDAIAQAKARLDWATSIGADKTYPSQYASATASYGEATQDRSDKKWDAAIAAAQRVLDALSGVTALAPLPAQYTVRPWATTKDCFWNIAGYPFVYGDPTKWKILYNANRSKLKNPDNPNLIFPGQVLDIPSLRGEARDGLWISGKAYAPLPPRK
jgi:nucleoid-associated protein YgaU